MRIAMSAESRLLDLREFREEVLISTCGLDNLEGGGCQICCGEGGTLLSTSLRILLPLKSTHKSWASKKSAPSNGRVTSARTNLWLKAMSGKSRCRVDVPYVLIPDPLAARREHEPSDASLSEAVAGNTETSAPESAKNNRPDNRSRTESVFVLVFF